jgi:hypothetical protein
VQELPNTEAAAESCMALPLFSTMTADQVNEVCGVVRGFVSTTKRESQPDSWRWAAAAGAAD